MFPFDPWFGKAGAVPRLAIKLKPSEVKAPDTSEIEIQRSIEKLLSAIVLLTVAAPEIAPPETATFSRKVLLLTVKVPLTFRTPPPVALLPARCFRRNAIRYIDGSSDGVMNAAAFGVGGIGAEHGIDDIDRPDPVIRNGSPLLALLSKTLSETFMVPANWVPIAPPKKEELLEKTPRSR